MCAGEIYFHIKKCFNNCEMVQLKLQTISASDIQAGKRLVVMHMNIPIFYNKLWLVQDHLHRC